MAHIDLTTNEGKRWIYDSQTYVVIAQQNGKICVDIGTSDNIAALAGLLEAMEKAKRTVTGKIIQLAEVVAAPRDRTFQ